LDRSPAAVASYRADILALQGLLDRDLSHWLTPDEDGVADEQ
jgi:hypothetical protein